MNLSEIKVERIIIHQIYERTPDKKIRKPLQSHDLTRFDNTAMNEFKKRIVEALGEDSKAVQMEIVKSGVDDLPPSIETLIDQNDDDFAVSSYDVAMRLAQAQQKRSLPGGIVVVFTGTYGVHSKKFLGIIKAEVHSAYEKQINRHTNEISLKFVEEVLLTPGTKLYKTAGFFEKFAGAGDGEDLNGKWACMVSDNQINQANGKAAAEYFYFDFLGLGYPKTSARTTMKFYEATLDFINGMKVSAEKKTDYHNALVAYLKTDQSSAVSAIEFADKYFGDSETRDLFKQHIEKKELPTTAFTKDIEHISSRLKTRKINFNSNIKIIAPADIFDKNVVIETIEGEADEAGQPKEWTKVIIKDRIVNQG